MNKLLIILSILFLNSTILADSKIIGHMIPLPTEKLSTSIRLSCGVKIQEWRGSNISATNVKRMEDLCIKTQKKFYIFAKSKGYELSTESSFSWSLSLIPDGRGYRELNDLKFRFSERPQKEEVWGYTSRTSEYIYMVSNTDLPNFDTIFAHEVYHSLSFNSGLYDNLPGNKSVVDEKLAREFTRYLGLGE